MSCAKSDIRSQEVKENFPTPKVQITRGYEMKRLIFTLSFCFLFAQQASAACGDFEKLIDLKLKDIAKIEASGFLDDSATRATMRGAEMSAGLQYVTLMVIQMQAAKCPVPNKPYNYGVYLNAASGCRTAKTEEEIKQKCDRANWQPYNYLENKDAP